ncbi:ATP-binding protein [Selenomonas ruminantium]|uniref:AAA family ATPase n=1 Tax=Selenomonas ruminantium TaxID=971 RepID=UPI0009B74FED
MAKIPTIKKFRCFENVLINFEPNYTVLIGVNGAGKSSILDAISIALGSFLAGMDGIRSNAIHTDDVRYRMFEEGTITISCKCYSNSRNRS